MNPSEYCTNDGRIRGLSLLLVIIFNIQILFIKTNFNYA
jgi:hypothetical protein